MPRDPVPRDRHLPGPNHRTAALESLPPANTRRWVPRRKAEVLAGIDSGLLTLDEACQRYSLTMEELATWQRLFQHGGIKGLRATRMQEYRAALECPIQD